MTLPPNNKCVYVSAFLINLKETLSQSEPKEAFNGRDRNERIKSVKNKYVNSGIQ